MQVTDKPKWWCITTPYDGSKENHWESQSRIRSEFTKLGGKSMKWRSGNCIPAHWIGYTVENPSPGYTINTHEWRIDNEDDAFMFMIACGNRVEIREDN